MKHRLALVVLILASASASWGRTNYCLQLLGTNSAMSTPTNSYNQRLRDFTVTARIRPTQPAAGTTQWIAARGLDYGFVSTKFALGLDSSSCPIFWVGSLGGSISKVRSNLPLRTNHWSHIAASYDHARNSYSIFVNGKIMCDQQVLEESSPEMVPGRTTIGANDSTPANPVPTLDGFFKGYVDEIQIWDVAFTQTQVISNRYVRPAGTESNLIAYWNFDGQTAGDATTNGMDGTLLGDAQIIPRYIACNPLLTLDSTDTPTLDFQTVTGITYLVEFSTNLAEEGWTIIGDMDGNGDVMSVEVPTNAPALRYYRAREQ